MKKIMNDFFKKLPFTSKYVGLVMCMLLFMVAGIQSANAQNLTVKAYNSIRLDVSVLDNIFGTVTVNDTVRTADYSSTVPSSNLPTTVAGFGGVQVVFANRNLFETPITLAQADALINYVKGGGILIGNFEGVSISGTSTTANNYIGSALLCNAVNVISSPGNSFGYSPINQYHPGNGALLLNSSGAASVTTTTTYSAMYNVPSENIIFAENALAPCGSQGALDIIVPAYPGCTSACGVNGFAILSGEAIGAMNAEPAHRNNTQVNINYAQLMYDFLYNPTAMATRRAWSTIATNKNTTCAPALAPANCLLTCNAGTTAPTLSATTKANVCPATTVDLTSITASNTPASTSLTWHTGTPATTANKVANPSAVAAGTYYAAFFDATNNCYSGTSGSSTTAVTATVATCTTPVTASNPAPKTTAIGTPLNGNAVTELNPTGGTAPYTYSNGSSDPACTAPSGATALPSGNLTINATTGAYTVTPPATAGTYYYCIKICDASTPTAQCVVKTYTLTVNPAAMGANNPPTQNVPAGTPYNGNAATDLAPTGGTAPYNYSNGSSDPACTAPSGATALPASSNLAVNSSTGAYSYTAPTTAGTYYFCIKVCDSATPTPQCIVKTYTVVVGCAVGTSVPTIH